MSETLDKVKEVVMDKLGVEESQITETAHFMDDLGADSLDQMELVMALEEQFGVEIPDEDAEKITRVREAISYITEHGK